MNKDNVEGWIKNAVRIFLNKPIIEEMNVMELRLLKLACTETDFWNLLNSPEYKIPYEDLANSCEKIKDILRGWKIGGNK